MKDETGNPSSAGDIAAVALLVAGGILSERRALIPRTFHLAGTGETSWAGFAATIFRHGATLDGPSAPVIRLLTSANSAAACRRQNSRLDCTRVKAAYGIVLPE